MLPRMQLIIEANEFVSEVHDRMPIILEADQFDPWLTGRAGPLLLRPAANEKASTELVNSTVMALRRM
jgi:putative SOS response-associated peptidase YedK